MSGHSKWSTIKRQKGVADAKRSAVFGKLARQIAVAARDGADPDTNFKLRLAIDRARAVNMPNDNVERAVAAGSGQNRDQALKEMLYEGFGPGQLPIIVQATTDNPNRTAGDLRSIFTKHGGSLGGTNSVSWMFDRVGVVTVEPSPGAAQIDDFTLAAIDAGANDFRSEENAWLLMSAPEKLSALSAWARQAGLLVSRAEVVWLPKTSGPDLSAEGQRLLEALDEHDDVDQVFTA